MNFKHRHIPSSYLRGTKDFKFYGNMGVLYGSYGGGGGGGGGQPGQGGG